jgi:hypothetical protein
MPPFVDQTLEAGLVLRFGKTLAQSIDLTKDRGDVLTGRAVGRNQPRYGVVVFGNSDLLPFGDAVKELGKVRFGVERADTNTGASAVGAVGRDRHNID